MLHLCSLSTDDFLAAWCQRLFAAIRLIFSGCLCVDPRLFVFGETPHRDTLHRSLTDDLILFVSAVKTQDTRQLPLLSFTNQEFISFKTYYTSKHLKLL